MKLSTTLIRRRIPILACWLVVSLGAGDLFLRGVSIDNSVGVWFPQDDPALVDYEQSLREFGESEWTLLMVEA